MSCAHLRVGEQPNSNVNLTRNTSSAATPSPGKLLEPDASERIRHTACPAQSPDRRT